MTMWAEMCWRRSCQGKETGKTKDEVIGCGRQERGTMRYLTKMNGEYGCSDPR